MSGNGDCYNIRVYVYIFVNKYIYIYIRTCFHITMVIINSFFLRGSKSNSYCCLWVLTMLAMLHVFNTSNKMYKNYACMILC